MKVSGCDCVVSSVGEHRLGFYTVLLAKHNGKIFAPAAFPCASHLPQILPGEKKLICLRVFTSNLEKN
jgi:hypothetical protein